MNKVKLQVDGKIIEANEGQNLLQAALDAGIYIPHLCYHPDLRPQGECKLCAVQIEGEEKIVQSCETIVKDGMVVHTKTENVNNLRMLALELMLASHPKDCTSCDKYLNCELQAIMQYMGVAHSRMREITKENTRIAASDRLIKKEMHRCIQCGRCVLVCEEVRGVNALRINKKNGETYINTYDDRLLIDSDCRYCGACVEVCPTGSIQDVFGIFSKDSPRNQALVPCKDKCPAHTNIPEYIRLTKVGRYADAVSVIREKLTFPLSLGYICTHACESGCKRTYLNEPISIRDIKRFAVENDKDETWRLGSKLAPPNGKKVGIVGGGPSGLTAAYYLTKKGYEVEVFEKQPISGGMLSYGIPKYRISQDIVNNEISILQETGFKITTNSRISSLDQIKHKDFDATLIAVGTTKGKRPPMYDKKWSNAIDAVDFCRMAIEGTLPDLGRVVTVYGGGNVAFDCARTAKKLGIETVRVMCLESREKMLADPEEIHESLEEGIEILNSKSITSIQEDVDKIKSVSMVSVKSFSFGPKGLEMEIEDDSEMALETDILVFATSQQPDLDISFGPELVRGSFVKVDHKMETNIEGVFAAGDSTYGTKSVVEAIASGRSAASNIDLFLGGDGDIEEKLYFGDEPDPNIGVIDDFTKLERISFLKDENEAKCEATRCLQCDLRLQIQKVKYWVDPHYKR